MMKKWASGCLLALLTHFVLLTDQAEDDDEGPAQPSCTGSFFCQSPVVIFQLEQSFADCEHKCLEHPNCHAVAWHSHFGFCNGFTQCDKRHDHPSFMSSMIPCPGEKVCEQLGLCSQGYFLTALEAQNFTECNQMCDNMELCQYSTFRTSLLLCLLYSECPKVDRQLCPNCITSSKDCRQTLAEKWPEKNASDTDQHSSFDEPPLQNMTKLQNHDVGNDTDSVSEYYYDDDEGSGDTSHTDIAEDGNSSTPMNIVNGSRSLSDEDGNASNITTIDLSSMADNSSSLKNVSQGLQEDKESLAHQLSNNTLMNITEDDSNYGSKAMATDELAVHVNDTHQVMTTIKVEHNESLPIEQSEMEHQNPAEKRPKMSKGKRIGLKRTQRSISRTISSYLPKKTVRYGGKRSLRSITEMTEWNTDEYPTFSSSVEGKAFEIIKGPDSGSARRH